METLFIYLVKSSGLIGMFYISYFLLLRKETFFNSNRWFLLAGLITSAVLPLIVFTKIVWVESTQTSFDWSKIPVTTNGIENEAFEINWYLVAAIVYGIGIIGFLIKFTFDFYSLSKVLKGKTIQRQADFKFIDVSENIAPFSFFNSIVYNSSLYSATELENILEHEKVHSSQHHTLDVLISRLFCIAFWFNPLVWLYKKAIVQNLEFIADSEASKKISDKKAYQLTLLKITTQENCVAITNHFYQSLIKKRIVMLNKNQSNKRNYWKYALVLPALVAFVLLYQVEVIAQKSTEQSNKTVTADLINYVCTISKKTSDNVINSEIKKFENKYNATIVFSGIKRNSKNEIIALKIEISSPDKTNNTFIYSDNQPIEDFHIFSGKFKNNTPVVGLFNGNSKSNKWKQTVRYNIPPPPPPTASKINSTIPAPAKQKNNAVAPPPPPSKPSKNTANSSALLPPPPPPSPTKNLKKTDKSIIKFVPPPPPIQKDKKLLNEKAIIIINGKRTQATIADLSNVDENLIESINVLKEKNAVKKYGKDGENGAVEISTKENVDLLKYSSTKTNKESELDKSEIENNGNEIVSSKTQWLETYKTIMKARFSLEKMKSKNEQAKATLEKARKDVKFKLLSS